jgi:endonuclease YncB( thermonuclease family)
VIVIRLALLALFIFFIASSYSGYSFNGRADVVDGDTLQIRAQHIRLYGIDAPEKGQSCDLNGKSWPCGRALVNCDVKTRDRQMRVLAVCALGDEDLSAWMVEQGWALALRQNAKDYVPHEARAKARRNGLWTSKFVKPWTWRAQRIGQQKER